MKLLKNGLLLLSLTLCLGCSSTDEKQIKVAATAVPHAEILEQAKEELQDQGYNLNIIVVDDYNTPNRALNDKEVDANFFQHQPFLDSQKEEFGYHIIGIAKIHSEPMGVYSKKESSISNLKAGGMIAVPSDPTNQARALLLLEKHGVVQLDRHDSKITVHNIVKNPKRFHFVEIDSPLLARTLDDVEAAAITTNFALQAGLSPQTDALILESPDSPFANLLVIREGDESRESIQALKKAMTSEKIRNFIQTKYKGAIFPAFYTQVNSKF